MKQITIGIHRVYHMAIPWPRPERMSRRTWRTGPSSRKRSWLRTRGNLKDGLASVRNIKMDGCVCVCMYNRYDITIKIRDSTGLTIKNSLNGFVQCKLWISQQISQDFAGLGTEPATNLCGPKMHFTCDQHVLTDTEYECIRIPVYIMHIYIYYI